MGRGSQEGGSQGSLIFAKITGTKPDETVHFELSRSNAEDKKSPISEGTEKKLTGYLVGAAHRTFTWQNNVIDTIALNLSDPAAGKDGETYRIEVTVASSLGRSIINSLLGADNFLAPLTLSLYNNKKNGYASVGVYLGGDTAKWKYTVEEQAKYVTLEKKKQKDATTGKLVNVEVKNYLELNDFFLTEFKNNVVPKVKPAPSGGYAKSQSLDQEADHTYDQGGTQSGTFEGPSQDESLDGEGKPAGKMPWD